VTTFPLLTWQLAGFRSIEQRTALDLSGLNVLVGANSAGKSSVLYSLLMTAQTLANPLVDRPLVLNGALAQLGLAEDCVNEASGRSLALGFTLRNAVTAGARTMRPHASAQVVSLNATFEMKHSGADFVLDTAEVALAPEQGAAPATRIKVSRRTQEAARSTYRSAGLRGNALEDALRARALEAELDAENGGGSTQQLVGARARQFLPEGLVFVDNMNRRELLRLTNPWWGLDVVRAEDRATRVSRPVAEFVLRYLRSFLPQEPPLSIDDFTTGRFVQHVSREIWQLLEVMPSSEWYAEHREELPFTPTLIRARLPDELDTALEQVRAFFADSLRHLGPLREEPRPLYGLPAAATGDCVGRSGEYTAAVLSAFRSRLVVSPRPDGGTARRVSLETAVDEWLRAMGLLSSVRSEERGKLGYEVLLNVEGVDRPLDLTTVGVGVSQVLPVVVLGLLSPPGSLICFEQPELHLHPDVQAALGDFFLALARTGRQLLLETHSEYLVNRLRRRAAEEGEGEVARLTKFFFFERHGSTSSIREVRMGDAGGFPSWPKGFLDQAAREVEALISAQRSRRTT
jgi:predicted ATPase